MVGLEVFFFVYIYWVFALQVFDQWKAIFTNIPRVRSIIGCGNDLYTDGGEETIFREYAHGLDLREMNTSKRMYVKHERVSRFNMAKVRALGKKK